MTDVHTKKQRSYNMSKIRSKWTKPEILIHNYLKGKKVRHRMHPDIEGKPDILLVDSNTVVFLDGCFWHKCPRCFKEPASNRDFWLPKIERNVERDNEITKKLKKMGWNVVRIREHDIKRGTDFCLKKIRKH